MSETTLPQRLTKLQKQGLEHLHQKREMLKEGNAYSSRQVMIILGLHGGFVGDNLDFETLSRVVDTVEEHLIAHSQELQCIGVKGKSMSADSMDTSARPFLPAYLAHRWQATLKEMVEGINGR